MGHQYQALAPPAILEVSLDDLVDVLSILVAVPHALGIDHHVGAVLATVEAARGIAAKPLDPQLPRLLAHIAAQFVDATGSRRAGAATAARMAFRAYIGAHEDMVLVEQPRVGGRI